MNGFLSTVSNVKNAPHLIRWGAFFVVAQILATAAVVITTTAATVTGADAVTATAANKDKDKNKNPTAISTKTVVTHLTDLLFLRYYILCLLNKCVQKNFFIVGIDFS